MSGRFHLRMLAQRGDYEALASAAQEMANEANHGDQAFATLMWAYATLRLNPHRHVDDALAAGERGLVQLVSHRHEDRDTADWACLCWSYMLQFILRDQEAAAVLRQLLERPDISVVHRLAALAALSHSLTMLGQPTDAISLLEKTGLEIDALSTDQITPWVVRERERIRLNLADHLLAQGRVEAASAELARVNQDTLTPIMLASHQVSQARIALMQGDWDLAEQLGQEANSRALAIGYAPLRADALGVLVAVAAYKGRVEDQRRLVIEMAATLTADSQ